MKEEATSETRKANIATLSVTPFPLLRFPGPQRPHHVSAERTRQEVVPYSPNTVTTGNVRNNIPNLPTTTISEHDIRIERSNPQHSRNLGAAARLAQAPSHPPARTAPFSAVTSQSISGHVTQHEGHVTAARVQQARSRPAALVTWQGSDRLRP